MKANHKGHWDWVTFGKWNQRKSRQPLKEEQCRGKTQMQIKAKAAEWGKWKWMEKRHRDSVSESESKSESFSRRLERIKRERSPVFHANIDATQILTRCRSCVFVCFFCGIQEETKDLHSCSAHVITFNTAVTWEEGFIKIKTICCLHSSASWLSES